MTLSTSALTSSNSSLADVAATAPSARRSAGTRACRCSARLKALSNRPFFDVISGLASSTSTFDFGLACLQVAGHHAGALVGPGRAAVGRLREWTSRTRRRRASPRAAGAAPPSAARPSRRAARGRCRSAGCQAADLVEHEVDAGRQHQPVVGQLAAAGQAHLLGRPASMASTSPCTTFTPSGLQAVVAAGDVGHLLVAAEHQVADRAGDEVRRCARPASRRRCRPTACR